MKTGLNETVFNFMFPLIPLTESIDNHIQSHKIQSRVICTVSKNSFSSGLTYQCLVDTKEFFFHWIHHLSLPKINSMCMPARLWAMAHPQLKALVMFPSTIYSFKLLASGDTRHKTRNTRSIQEPLLSFFCSISHKIFAIRKFELNFPAFPAEKKYFIVWAYPKKTQPLYNPLGKSK